MEESFLRRNYMGARREYKAEISRIFVINYELVQISRMKFLLGEENCNFRVLEGYLYVISDN